MVDECINKEANLKKCTCSYPSCPRKGKCCECISYHLSMKELPGCVFTALSENGEEAEASYDRSFENFAKSVLGKG